jgi:dephospho-CoA kinase
MGKSTAAAHLRRLGVPVYDADRAVHNLFARGGGAIEVIRRAFPEAVIDGAVDRTRLGALVFGDPERLALLESIVHPLVRQSELHFRRRKTGRHKLLTAFDIPLLFETNGQRRYDVTIVLSAPDFVQAARVLTRKNMTSERLAAIRARQVPNIKKRRLADFVVPTGLDRRMTLQRLARIVRFFRGRHALLWLKETRGRTWRRRCAK